MTRVSTSKNDYASQIFQLDLKPKSPRTHEAGNRRVSQKFALSVQPAPAIEWKIINNLAEKKAAKKK